MSSAVSSTDNYPAAAMELARKLVLYYFKMLENLSVEPQTCSPRRYRLATGTPPLSGC